MEELWQRAPSRKRLRDFGWVVGGALIALGGLLAWRHPERGAHPWMWAAGLILVIGGAVAPRVLKAPFQLWMAFAFVLGLVMTNVILTLTYLIALTCVGLLMRLFRHDTLDIQWKSPRVSYWQDREDVPIHNRHLRPY